MPEAAQEKIRSPLTTPPIVRALDQPPFAELGVTSNFSFLRGASFPDELVFRAAELGYTALSITDHNSLAGIVRAHVTAKTAGLKLLIGARLVLVDAPDVLVWASDRAGYARLCRLLTVGRRRAIKGECTLSLADLLEHQDGLWAAIVPPDPTHADASYPIGLLKDTFGDRLSLLACCPYGVNDDRWLQKIADLSRTHRVPLLASNDVHYHDPSRRMLQDVLTCVRHKCTLAEAGCRLFPHGERYLKPPGQMHRLFAKYPEAIERGLEIAAQCTFSLGELKYEYPDEVAPLGKTPIEYLTDLTWKGAAERYPHKVPDKVRGLVEQELALIAKMKIEAYFLTVYDLVRFARSRDILCQGRGSAANSAAKPDRKHKTCSCPIARAAKDAFTTNRCFPPCLWIRQPSPQSQTTDRGS